MPCTGGYTHAVGVWDSSIVQGPFSVAPCAKPYTLRFAASLHIRRSTSASSALIWLERSRAVGSFLREGAALSLDGEDTRSRSDTACVPGVRFSRYRFPATDLNSKANKIGNSAYNFSKKTFD